MPTGVYKRTKSAWNKGLKGFLIGENSPHWKGGKFISKCQNCGEEFNYFPSHKRKYCSQPCAKEGLSKTLNGENHHSWKGNAVKYGALHDWVRSRKGPAKQCIVCNRKQTETGKSINWANLDGKYKRNVKDFMELCISCHRCWDSGNMPINLYEWRVKTYAV